MAGICWVVTVRLFSRADEYLIAPSGSSSGTSIVAGVGGGENQTERNGAGPYMKNDVPRGHVLVPAEAGADVESQDRIYATSAIEYSIEQL